MPQPPASDPRLSSSAYYHEGESAVHSVPTRIEDQDAQRVVSPSIAGTVNGLDDMSALGRCRQVCAIELIAKGLRKSELEAAGSW